MAISLAPPKVCTECREPVERRRNGELVHTDTDRMHCLWPSPARWRRLARRA